VECHASVSISIEYVFLSHYFKVYCYLLEKCWLAAQIQMVNLKLGKSLNDSKVILIHD
jgi:hypothetical protein